MEKYLILLFSNLTVCASGQTSLDSIKLFKDFELHGRTTAGAYTHFTDLINEGRKATLISVTDLQTLNSIIQNCKIKKHRQTKFGLDNIYIVGFNKGKEERIVIASGQVIVNLTSRLEYHLTDTQKRELNRLTDTWKE